MTIDEKRTAIRTYCEERSECGTSVFDVTECPLKGVTDKLCYNSEDDNAIEEYYNKLFGKDEEEAPVDNVISHPKHYCRDGAMESIEEMIMIFGKEVVKHFCLCNIWKYRYRSADKNGAEDIKKSDEYVRIYERLCE